MKERIDLLVWFYRQRARAENLIKEANNDAGLAAHPPPSPSGGATLRAAVAGQRMHRSESPLASLQQTNSLARAANSLLAPPTSGTSGGLIFGWG